MDGNIQKYKAFITAVDNGSFTKAAAILGYAQSSVSKMIADLEKDWNLTLLERNRGGIQLTPEGEAMLPYIRSLLESSGRVEEQAASLAGLVTGTIRIGTFASVAEHWLPGIIQRFQADYPGIHYEMLLGDYGEIEAWIQEGRASCGFLRLPAGSGLETVGLEQDEYVAVLPKGHPLSLKQHLEPHDIDGEPFMLLENRGRSTEVTEWIGQNYLKPDIRFTTWDDYAVLSMVESGLGIGILPELILSRNAYRVEIRRFNTPLCRKIGFAAKEGSHSPVLEKFKEYLKYRK